MEIIRYILLTVLLIVGLIFIFENNSGDIYLDIENYTLDCHKSKQPWNRQKCEFIEKDLSKEVSYIPDGDGDRLNEVNVPFTKEKFNVELINVNLWEPWDFEFLPDGSILFTQRIGSIVYFDGKNQEEVFSIEPVVLFETGLLGIVLDPDFANNNFDTCFYNFKICIRVYFILQNKDG